MSDSNKMDDAEWDRIAELGGDAQTDREWFEMATAELRAERDHFSSWIVAMLDDDHLWREQGEDRLRWNVQTMLRGALHYAQVGDTDE